MSRLIAAQDLTTASGMIFVPPPTGTAVTDTAAVVTALASGKSIVLGAGTYVINPGQLVLQSGQYIIGQGLGEGGTTLKKNANGILIEISGTAIATRRQRCGLYYLKLWGNDLTGNLVHSIYSDHLTFRDVYFFANQDVALHLQGYDCLFHGCQWEFCGGLSQPCVRLQNPADESTNAIWFEQCRWESFKFGCLDLVGNSFNLHSLYITDCKMETSMSRGAAFLQMTGDARNIHVNKLYCALVGYDTGYVAGQNPILAWTPYQSSSFCNVQFYNNQTNVWAPLGTFWGLSTGGHTMQNVVFETTQAYGSGACINQSNAPNFVTFIGVRNAVAGVTTPIFGNASSAQMMGDFLPAFAGAVTDASWTSAGMPTPVAGQMAIDSTNSKLYVRVAAAWKSVTLT